MSGRGRGHGKGRGRGRKGTRNSRSGNNKSSSTPAKKEMKFTTQTPGKTVYETYATVKEHIIQRIQKNYEYGSDVSKCLKTGKLLDWDTEKPIRTISQITDEKKQVERQIEQEGFNIDYQEKLRRHLDREKGVKEGLLKAYSEIFSSFCTKPMQQRIEEHPDFENEIDDNPIKLLEVIKELQHSPMRARHPFITMVDAALRFQNMKQQENEDLHAYSTRFKQLRDVYKSHVGTRILDHWAEHLVECQTLQNDVARETFKDSIWDMYCAYMFLRNSDQAKYGSRLQDLQNQYALGNDQYPNTLTAAIDILANHKLDDKYRENQRRKREQAQTERQSNSSSTGNTDDGSSARSFAQDTSHVICHCCGKKGHYAPDCNKRNSIPRDQWHVNRAIQHLQESEQGNDSADDDDDDNDDNDNDNASTTSRSNRRSDTPRRTRSQTPQRGRSSSRGRTSWSQGFQLAFQAFATAFTATDSDSSDSDDDEPPELIPRYPDSEDSDDSDDEDEPPPLVEPPKPKKPRVQMANKQLSDLIDRLRELLVLDTGSTINTLCNEDMGINFRAAKNPIYMNTNAGSKKMTVECDVPELGKFFYDSEQMANICSFAWMADNYKITYNNVEEDAFLIHTPDGIIKFARHGDLYVFEPSQEFLDGVARLKGLLPPVRKAFKKVKNAVTKAASQVSNMVSTVAENLKGYTKKQIERARRARRMYHIVGCPTVANFKQLLKMNAVKNCPVTAEDVDIAEQIFGADIGALKGKTTTRRPLPVKNDYVEIPKELTMKIDNLTLYMDVMYTNGLPMLTCIDSHVRFRSLVNLANRTANELYSAMDDIFRVYNFADFVIKFINCDREFKTFMDAVKDALEITMNYPPAKSKVPEAERNNQTIGERIRSTYHNLPYKAIPKVMVRYLAMICTDQLNWFPVKGGISSYYSPKVIMSHQALDYNKHCQVPFGTYVQADQIPDPKNTPAARTIDAIYLRPLLNKQGGHEVMNLATGRVVTCVKVWEKPATEFVIKAVETMAAEQKIKSLKVTGQNKVPLFPANWIAGVDYDGYDPYGEDDHPEPDDEYDYDEDHPIDDDFDEDDYDRIDQDEIDELLAEPGQQHREPAPIDMEQQNDANENAENEIENADDENEADEVEAEPDEAATPERESDEPDVPETEETEEEQPRKSTRTKVPVERLTYSHDHSQVESGTKTDGKKVRFTDDDQHILEMCHNLIAQVSPNPKDDAEYTPAMATVIARVMCELNAKGTAEGICLGQQYMLPDGLRIFGKNGRAATGKELKQLHDRQCFAPMDISKLTSVEKRKAMEALMFLTEKRDGSIKGRMVYNGKPTREWLPKGEAASPTVSLEAVFLTAIVDAKEGRDVMTADIPNAFIQAMMPELGPGKECVVMKITGVLVDLLVEIAPKAYGPYVVLKMDTKSCVCKSFEHSMEC